MNRSLITITSCNRLQEVKKFIWDYLKFVNSNNEFHFVLSLDGNNQTYIVFCETYDIPLIYSEEREGVGLSKNRVLTQFPDYDYYFFIEDDVELINESIFNHCIGIYNKTGYPHLCGNYDHAIENTKAYGEYTLDKSYSGGGYFSFFTNEGLKNVGGWNTLFAKYKRFGHTEHTYRFYHSKLQPSPFIFSRELNDMIMIHDVVSVTKHSGLQMDNMQLVIDERKLIDQKTTYFPLSTLSPFHFNDKQLGHNKKVKRFLEKNPQKYPLTTGKPRKKAMGEYYALMINNKSNSHLKNLFLAIKSMYFAPMNNELKHKIKYYFKK